LLFDCGIRNDDPRLLAFIQSVDEVSRGQDGGVMIGDPRNVLLDRDTFKRCSPLTSSSTRFADVSAAARRL
jgi:hypothetical protein